MILKRNIQQAGYEGSEPSYADYLAMPQWRMKRLQILKRDNKQCRSCGSKDSLHVHHRQYHTQRKTGIRKKPWEYENRYLVTLCASCHRNGHLQYQIPVFSI
jgi:5-methylcytosine-specific restriction endonuclease McrA